MKLYCGNLPFDTVEGEVRQLFDPYDIQTVTMIADRETTKFRGFAFVEVTLGERAIEEMNGFEFGGRKLVVNEARPREARPRENAGGERKERRRG